MQDDIDWREDERRRHERREWRKMRREEMRGD